MAKAESTLNTTAGYIARAPAPAENQDSIDLSAAMVALLESKIDFGANVKVAQAFEQLNGTVLDMLA